MQTVNQKIVALRQQMQIHQIDACLVPSADPHMSEYLPEHWQTRQWLSGFTGSVGTLLITQDFAGLWVDGRYWVQAEQQLAGTAIQLQKLTHQTDSTHLAWLNKHLNTAQTLAVDGCVLSVQQYQLLKQALPQGTTLRTDLDLIQSIWFDRPILPNHPIYAMQRDVNALSCTDKLNLVISQLKQKNVEAHFISALDDIAWLLNCRGADVDYNPIFLAHFYIDVNGKKVLFIDAQKLNAEICQQFIADNIEIQPYKNSVLFLKTIDLQSILIDPAKVSIVHQKALQANIDIVHDINPSTLLKACKQPSEIEHVRQTMIQDGIALCQFFAWLEQAISNKKHITELTIDEKLTGFRAQQQGFKGLSFATIAGFAENGALPHYRATPAQYSVIDQQGLLLIDSGGQYETGTTDITRVIPIGQPTPAQCFDYTIVLKAHIALAETVFPEGVAAPLLDSIGRQALWQHQLDFRHGTGHGVGFALNVHEGPQSISYYAPITPYSAMKEGMITSNEPGLYREGHWGIRIENLVVNQIVGNSDFGKFLKFETLTLCPINTTCIQLELLTDAEKQWLNQYHAEVYAKLSPHLQGDALKWLENNTQAI